MGLARVCPVALTNDITRSNVNTPYGSVINACRVRLSVEPFDHYDHQHHWIILEFACLRTMDSRWLRRFRQLWSAVVFDLNLIG
jgi:hypothetical protein